MDGPAGSRMHSSQRFNAARAFSRFILISMMLRIIFSGSLSCKRMCEHKDRLQRTFQFGRSHRGARRRLSYVV
jgi:hypothetical protein